MIRGASGLVNPGAISSPQVIRDQPVQSLPTYPVSENALKHQVHIASEYYSGFKVDNTQKGEHTDMVQRAPDKDLMQRETNVDVMQRVSNGEGNRASQQHM